MDEYIHTSNTKLGVFRDVIIEQDYDPLKAHQHTIRIPTGASRGGKAEVDCAGAARFQPKRRQLTAWPCARARLASFLAISGRRGLGGLGCPDRFT